MVKQAVTPKDILSLAIATLTESVGLFLWVYFVDNHNQLLGLVILIISLLAERIAVVIGARDAYGEHPLPKNFYSLVVFSAFVEGVVWIVWLIIWDNIPGMGGKLAAMVAMFVMQLLAHSWQMSFALNKPPLFRFANDGLTIAFSAIEAVGTFGWLFLFRNDNQLLSGVVLLLAFTIEHIVQGLAVQKAMPPNFS